MKFPLFLAFLLAGTSMNAQRLVTSIQVLSKVSSDGVWLRWAPTRFELWKSGNANGYHIDRFTLNPDGSLLSTSPTRLTSTPLKPVSEQEFARLGSTRKETAAVGELIWKFQSNAASGNSPSALLQRTEENDHRFGMALVLCDMSYEAAQAAGLFFKDTTAKKGERYVYRVAIQVSPELPDPGVCVVDTNSNWDLKGFNDVSARFGDRNATLTWSTVTHKGIYSAYIIERSRDNKVFAPLTDLPYMNLTEDGANEGAHYADSLDANGITYYYRVFGLTPFGDKSPPSNVVSGSGKDDLTGAIVVREVRSIPNKTSVVKWDFPSAMEGKINGFQVATSAKAQGPFSIVNKTLVDKKTRELELGKLRSSVYVVVKAVDKTGSEVAQSFPWFAHIEDNVPPSAPRGLQGKVSTAGEAMLTWIANTEPDIQGYRVFVAQSEKSEYVEVTRSLIGRPAFTEPLSAGELDKHLWFKVVAVDQSFNNSPYSEPASLALPDRVAPTAPVFTSTDIGENQIKLGWVRGIGTDLALHTLERSSREDTTWRKMRDFKSKDNPEYSDSRLSTGTIYRYRLSACDTAGNCSRTVSKDLPFGSGVKKSITDFTAFIDREHKTVKLTWKYPQRVQKILIYRKKNEEKLSLYQQLDGSVDQFEDKLLLINNLYTYRIQMIIDQESRTALSDELKVQL